MSTILSLAPQKRVEAFLFVDTDSPSVRTHGKISSISFRFRKRLGLESFVDEAGNVIIQ